MKYFVIFSFSLVQAIMALPGGAPEQACRDMKPNHHGKRPSDLITIPFELNAEDKGSHFEVRIDPKDRRDKPMFGGFLIQARNDRDEVIGEFGSNDEAIPFRFVSCSSLHPKGSVTHANTNSKKEVDFKWTPPKGFRGKVIFKATVAESFNRFWVGLETRKLVTDDHTSGSGITAINLPLLGTIFVAVNIMI